MNQFIDLDTQIKEHASIKDKVRGIHGGILHQGVNLMDEDLMDYNLHSIELTLVAAEHFSNCRYIVFHPGNIIFNRNCSFRNLISLVSKIEDPRFMIEFEPIFGYTQRYSFPLHLVEDWVALKKAISKSIVVDTGHALITAHAMNYEQTAYLKDLIHNLEPTVIHLAMKGDGKDGYEDAHLHLYEGNYDLFNLRDELIDKMVVIEVNNTNSQDLEFVRHLGLKKFNSRDQFLNAIGQGSK